MSNEVSCPGPGLLFGAYFPSGSIAEPWQQQAAARENCSYQFLKCPEEMCRPPTGNDTILAGRARPTNRAAATRATRGDTLPGLRQDTKVSEAGKGPQSLSEGRTICPQLLLQISIFLSHIKVASDREAETSWAELNRLQPSFPRKLRVKTAAAHPPDGRA